jgi:hypothetical protein
MVCIFVAGGLSMWDDLDGVTERRATLPGPVAVLDSVWRVIWVFEMRATSNTVRECVEWQQLCLLRWGIQTPLNFSSSDKTFHSSYKMYGYYGRYTLNSENAASANITANT